MKEAYIPIVNTKPAEYKALEMLGCENSSKILPLFEVSEISRKEDGTPRMPVSVYLDKVVSNITKVRKGQKTLVDVDRWNPSATTETGEYVLPYIYSKLNKSGVIVIPVIGYDRWEGSEDYQNALRDVELINYNFTCIRLGSQTLEDIGDSEFFNVNKVKNLLNDLSLEPDRCGVLLDFGSITTLTKEVVLDKAESVLNALQSLRFKFFSIAGCSVPTSITSVAKRNSDGKILRKEWLIWKTLRVLYPQVDLLFGDYGIRGPGAPDGSVFIPNANGKIWYTIGDRYYVVRGHSLYDDKGKGFSQYHDLAKGIVNSNVFMGAGFSWGDSELLIRSQKKMGTGNASTWIGISTNHHLSWVIAEIEEAERSVIFTQLNESVLNN